MTRWIPDLIRLVQYWEEQSLNKLNEFYANLLIDSTASDYIDALLRFLYDIQLYELVRYLLEKNVEHYQHAKLVSSSMNAFHESCIYGFSHVCLLLIRDHQDVNEPFSLIYVNRQTNKKETIRNLTGLQLACLWSKYFPKRLVSYAHTVRLLINHGARVNMTSTELSTALHWTCRAKHTTQLAQELIESGADIHAQDRMHIRPIHYACWSRNRILIDLLLNKGARLTDEDDFGRTTIHFLCMPKYLEAICTDDQQEQHDLLAYLLMHDWHSYNARDLLREDSQGQTSLVYACVSHNCSLVELLVRNQPELVNMFTNDGHTPLMISINEGFLDGVDFLLKQSNLERNRCDRTGNTAIHHACMHINPSISIQLLRLLLDQNHNRFDLEKRNEHGQDPFVLCTINQSVDNCRLFIEHDVSVIKPDRHGRQSLHIACQTGNYELVALLLTLPQININAVDNCNRNCLFYAIVNGDEQIVNLLIDNHIRVNVRDVVSDTPLHLAVQHRSNACELTRCILKASDGIDLINQSAADGMTPILLAAHCQQADVIYVLLKNDVNVHAVDNEQHTALHLACKSDCMKSAFYLIEFSDLNVNQVDFYGQTAIFYAFANSNYDLVQYLISCGAKIDVYDNQNYLPLHIGILLSDGNDRIYDVKLIDLYNDQYRPLLNDQNNQYRMTPLILASMQCHLNVVQYLVRHCQVDLMSKCSNGHTALHYACLTQHDQSIELIEYLMDHGCTYEQVDQPKGSFLYTIVQHAARQAMMFFIRYSRVSALNIQRKRDRPVLYCVQLDF
jgi:ankyrin repeat protein